MIFSMVRIKKEINSAEATTKKETLVEINSAEKVERTISNLKTIKRTRNKQAKDPGKLRE